MSLLLGRQTINPTSPDSVAEIIRDPANGPFLGRWIESLAGSIPWVRGLKYRTELTAILAFCLLHGPYIIALASTETLLNAASAALVSAALFIGSIESNRVFRDFRLRGSDIDDMLDQDTVPSRASFCSSARKIFHPIWQFSIAFAVALCVVGLGVGIPSQASYLTVALGYLFSFSVGFVAGCGVYLILLASLTAHKLGSAKRLHINWAQPLWTPGLLALSRAFRRSAQTAMVMLVLVTTALLAKYFDRPSNSALMILAISVAVGFLSVFGVGIMSQVWLARAADNSRDATLTRLSTVINETGKECESAGFRHESEVGRLAKLVQIQTALTSTQYSYNDRTIFAAYAAAAVGVILQFVLAAFISP
jgi:hypothetical protein